MTDADSAVSPVTPQAPHGGRTTALRVVVRRAGGPEALVVDEVPVPVPAAGQVLIAVETAGVAFGDVMARDGRIPGRFPKTPGYDVVGRITALGPDVARSGLGLAVGQRVAALTGTGGYATAAVAQAGLCVPVPEDVDAARVSALVLNYVTARQMLRVAEVPSGGSVLVLGAAGGVGSALAELARLEGLTVYGTASAERRALLAERGVVPLADHDGLPGPVDAVFDPVGGPSLARSRRATRRGGTVVAFGISYASARGWSKTRTLTAALGALARAALTPGPRTVNFVITSRAKKDPAALRQDLAHLVDLLRAGRIAPRVTTLPLLQVAGAHRRLEAGQVDGKLVLTV